MGISTELKFTRTETERVTFTEREETNSQLASETPVDVEPLHADTPIDHMQTAQPMAAMPIDKIAATEPATPAQPRAPAIPLRRANGEYRNSGKPTRWNQSRVGVFHETSRLDPTKGAQYRFRVSAPAAERLQLELYDKSVNGTAKLVITPDTPGATLKQHKNGTWEVVVPSKTLSDAGLTPNDHLFYGYRAWGSNWKYDPAWKPGSQAGFISDVDGNGSRFNPNKLLLDPSAAEVSHEGWGAFNPEKRPDDSIYASGDANRLRDSGGAAPKAIALPRTKPSSEAKVPRIKRSLKDEIVYEGHVRGLTMNHPDIPEAMRGTFAAIGHPAFIKHLKDTGVTMLELLPVQMYDRGGVGDSTTQGVNYWGYATEAFAAPNKAFAFDKGPGGPTREFREMVQALHRAGIRVALDVVFNHTGEGGQSSDAKSSQIRSFRGLDNAMYYETTKDGRFGYDDNGVGANFNAAEPRVQQFVIDTVKKWAREFDVDMFRYDLAAVVGNVLTKQAPDGHGFEFDAKDTRSLLVRLQTEIPDAAHVAEPYTTDSFELGQFPKDWSEWNTQFRDTRRAKLNAFQGGNVSLYDIRNGILGSPNLYSARGPQASVNFNTVHDGFTLNDLVSYNSPQNHTAFGFSDGGSDNNISYDQGGNRDAQKQAARFFYADLMLSAGMPLITAGDEFLRTQHGNNNAYNQDNNISYLDYSSRETNKDFLTFAQQMAAFRHAHPALRPDHFMVGAVQSDGLKDTTFYAPRGEADNGYMSSAADYLGQRINGTGVPGETAKSIFIARNFGYGHVQINLPVPRPDCKWVRVFDTDKFLEGHGNFDPVDARPVMRTEYGLNPRSLATFIEIPR